MQFMARLTPSRLSALLLALGASLAPHTAAHAQAWAKANLDKSPRHGEYVTLHEPNGRSLQAWVVYPEVKGKAPVVVMIHEIFGLSDWAREMADEVAAAGYIVIEPDLLSGYGPAPATGASVQPPLPAEHAAHLQLAAAAPAQDNATHQMPGMSMGQGSGTPFVPATPGGTAAFPDQSAVVRAVSSLPDPGVLQDLDTAADYGKHLPAASGKLFVTGFCWGGGKTFLFATHRHDLSAAIVFYGPPPPAAAMASINAPVYGFYAGNDARITSTLDGTKTDMKTAGKRFEATVYDGAGHGFMRAGEAPDATPANAAARKAGLASLVSILGGAQ